MGRMRAMLDEEVMRITTREQAEQQVRAMRARRTREPEGSRPSLDG